MFAERVQDLMQPVAKCNIFCNGKILNLTEMNNSKRAIQKLDSPFTIYWEPSPMLQCNRNYFANVSLIESRIFCFLHLNVCFVFFCFVFSRVGSSSQNFCTFVVIHST